MSICRRCKKNKESSDFYRRKGGHHTQCKDCVRERNQINWATAIVENSRKNDAKAPRVINDDDYINDQWVKELVQNNPNCHYCDVPLQYGIGINRKTHPDGLQPDRMDSSRPHTKSNCVQCCHTCNKRCQTLPYEWKRLSHGGQFEHFGAGWCPSKTHDGGDGDEHVRSIDEFSISSSRVDGLDSYCRSCNAFTKKRRRNRVILE